MQDEISTRTGQQSNGDRSAANAIKKYPVWVLKYPPTAFVLAGLSGLGLAIWSCCWVIGDAWQGLASSRWFRAEGIVVRSEVEQSHPFVGGTQYRLKVSYRYTVDEHEYRNGRISFPEVRGGADEEYYQRQLDANYPIGKPCAVYYNPNSPDESCLEPGPSYPFMAIGCVISTALLVGGVFCLVLGIRRLRAAPEPEH